MRDYTIDWAISQGQNLFSEEGCHSHTITCIENNQNWDMDKIYNKLLERGYRMDRGYGNLRGKAFRIPHMGNIYMEDLKDFISEFEKVIHV
jgi:aspartate aminotransferase-like enzyme